MDGCPRCFPKDDPEAAWAHARDHERTHILTQESHFSAVIYRCGACRQQFLDVFCERIDWQNGEDPQSWLIVPITDEEVRQFVALGEDGIERAVTALTPKRRYLAVDYFGGPKQIDYLHGPHMIAPHD
jgi:hypothetical protein